MPPVPPLIALLLTLWSLVGSAVVVHEVDGPVRFTDLYGNARETSSALACHPDGSAHLWLMPAADLRTVTHELAHAYDCLDDGEMNASPIAAARPRSRPWWASEYCWDTDAEWYACWAVHSGSVHTPPVGSAR